MPSSASLFTGRAHGKVILSGEHAILYDQPAVVAGLALFVEATIVLGGTEVVWPKEYGRFYHHVGQLACAAAGISLPPCSITVSGSLPLGTGFGGSAAVATAVIKAIFQVSGQTVTEAQLLDLVMQAERVAHGTSSGIDPAAVIKGGLLVCHKRPTGLEVMRVTAPTITDQAFFLIDSGKPVESTKDMVAFVAARYRQSGDVAGTLTAIGQVTNQVIDLIHHNRWQPAWLTENERLLEALGVVSPSAQELVKKLEDKGAYVKVTGAGGRREGAGYLLAYHPEPERLSQWLTAQHLQYQVAQLGVAL